MSAIHFFALLDDLLPVLEHVESRGKLKYAQTGNFRRDELVDTFVIYDAGHKLPALGQASGYCSVLCDAYLVCANETEIQLEHFQGNDGPRACLNQLHNADSVVLLPGGEWDGESIIKGYVGTASKSPGSQAIMRRFRSAIKKTFTKVRAFYIGPGALERFKQGARLTDSVQSPREYDLAPE